MKKTICFSNKVRDLVERIFSNKVRDYIEWPEMIDKVAHAIVGPEDDDPLAFIECMRTPTITVCFDSAGEEVLIFKGAEEDVIAKLSALQVKIQKVYKKRKLERQNRS